MSKENVDVVRTVYEAWARDDLPGPAHLLDPQIEYVNPGGAVEPGTRRGLEEFGRAVEKVFEGLDTWQIEPERFIPVGEWVAVVVRYRAHWRASGVDVEAHESALWTVRDGKVVRYEWFHGPNDALEAAGLSELAMSEENVEIVRSIYEATNRRDWDAAFRDQSPDIELILPPPYGPYRGREETQSHWEDRLAAFDAAIVEPEEVFESGDQVVVVVKIRARPKGSSAEIEIRIGHLWTFRDGKAVSMRLFPKPGEALEAAGVRE